MERLASSVVALEPLVDPSVSAGHDFASESNTLLIAFAAMSKLVPPPFHFFETTTGLPVKRLFVRDPAMIWYQRGVPGFGDSIDEAAASLKAIVTELGAGRLVVIGSSAGGYAALAFGALLEADFVVSFSPQTMLERAWLDEVGDDRWPGHCRNLELAGGPDPRWADLSTALLRERRAGTEMQVHHSGLLETDTRHAERLAEVPGVQVVAHDERDHNFIQGLRNRRKLAPIFRAAGIDRPS